MKNSRIYLFLFLSIAFIACRETQSSQTTNISEEIKTDSISIQLDTSVIAVIPYDTIIFSGWHNLKNVKTTELTQLDLLEIEYILTNCIAEYNVLQKQEFDKLQTENPDWNYDINQFIIDLKKHKRQYVAIFNSTGEKEVWINCFCDTWNKNWRKSIAIVCDGGNCYFQLKINITQKKYYDFYVNGHA